MTFGLLRREPFVFLINDICRTLNLPSPVPPEGRDFEQLTVRLVVDKISFELFFQPESVREGFLLQCLVGMCPDDDGALMALLGSNLEMLRNEQGCFGLRADEGVIIFSTWVPFDGVSGQHICSMMQALVKRFTGWQNSMLGGFDAIR